MFGAILIAIGAWWTRKDSSPPAQEPVSPQVESGTAEAERADAGEEPTEVAPVAAVPPQEVATAPEAVAPAPQAAAPANPIIGSWSCFDPVSGRSGHYGFESDGTLTIDWADGQAVYQKYELSGRVVKLPETQPASTFTIEQLATERMILNIGQDRRLACTR